MCFSQVLRGGGRWLGERVRWRGQGLRGHLNDQRMNGCSVSHGGSSPGMAFQPQPEHLIGAGEIAPSSNTSREHTLETTPRASGLSRGGRNPRGRGHFPWGDYCDVTLRGLACLHLPKALGPFHARIFPGLRPVNALAFDNRVVL